MSYQNYSNMNFHSGLRHQRGAGIGAIFGSIFRALRPLASMGLSAGKKFLGSNLARQIGSTALDIGKRSAKNIITDVLEGVPLTETASKQLEEAKSKIASMIKEQLPTIPSEFRGGGRKRKRRKNIKNNCKKVAYSLIDD